MYFLTENLSAYNQLCVIRIENPFLPLDSKLHKDKTHVAAHHCNPSVTAQHLKCSVCSEFVDQMTEQRQTRKTAMGKKGKQEGLLYGHYNV